MTASAVFVERGREHRRNRTRIAHFNLTPLQHVHQLAVAQDADRRRRGRIRCKRFAGAFSRLDVLGELDAGDRRRECRRQHRLRGTA